jgi:hypothetical protein
MIIGNLIMGAANGVSDWVANTLLMPLVYFLFASLAAVVVVVYDHDKTLAMGEATAGVEIGIKNKQLEAQEVLNATLLVYIRANEKRLYQLEQDGALDKQSIANIDKSLKRIEKAVGR